MTNHETPVDIGRMLDLVTRATAKSPKKIQLFPAAAVKKPAGPKPELAGSPAGQERV
jgi:hypothetical protein